MAVGLDNVSFTLNRAGWKDEIKQLPSMLLGAIEASPWQISQLYQSLANGGETKQLHTVIAVITESGESFRGYNPTPVQAISPSAAFLTKFAMHQVTQSGTARSLRWQHPNKRLAGKTGTTDDLRDSWYAGFDNNEATIVWLGRDDNKSTGLTGSSGALTVYSELIKHRGAMSISLAPPGNIVSGYFSSVTGRPSDKYCNDVVQLPALDSTWQNTESCYAAPVKAAKSVFDDFLSFFAN